MLKNLWFIYFINIRNINLLHLEIHGNWKSVNEALACSSN